MRSISLAFSWFSITVITFTFSILLLLYISYPQKINLPVTERYQLYKSLPYKVGIASNKAEIKSSDGRSLIIHNFFKKHNAPLQNNADAFVKVADKYNLDFRLLPAISMQESNGGKKIPEDSFNPFGYGIYGDNVLKFDNFDLAIERVGKGLKDDYLNQGLKTPYQIMTKYTPPSLEKGGPWAIGVNTFMEELQ